MVDSPSSDFVQWVFINGKQKRLKRSPTIDGMYLDEFIAANADPIWLLQNEMWEVLEAKPEPFDSLPPRENDVPF